MGKVGKIAFVLVLAVVVVGVIVVKKGGDAAPSANARSLTLGQPSSEMAGSLPRLVDLGSTTCIPCKMMMPVLEEMRKEYAGRMQVEFIDVNANADEARAFGIRLIPTQVFLDAAGKELWRHEGFIPKEEIMAKWKELGVSFGNGPGSR